MTSGSGPVIETDGLSRSYPPDIRAVDDLRLTVRPGEVYGFLGRNGAGKTTTMRMLVGLVRPTAGTGRVLGRPLGDPAALARVGSLIEAPAFQPHLSGLDNLRLLARYLGVGDPAARAALDQVDLAGRAAHRYRTYSLGMKQRLGVAAALLDDPELLILDEPTNGLDPAGMAAMRDLFRSLAGRGRTVLLSSHLLGEVAQVCDRIGIIHAGRLVVEGDLAEVQARLGGPGTVSVRVRPVEAALARLRELPGVRVLRVDGELVELGGGTAAPLAADAADQSDRVAGPELAAEINEALVLAGVRVSELSWARHTLEEVFLDLTTESPDPPRQLWAPGEPQEVRR
ncbi:ATP-binding cassette domain-containing protein [Solwaraspora sp. WMMD1047]|uniref:ABC transporter ATP-binding protein n=1 Tax=Solwaraspora sp. WMMD1047 TaxID=3016102 RepID=UPI0024159703|nr:ATP-binding cassette domain-containing protein [Solwaraspora sp. WMMD1047]MDG4832116.1 ATP-binding cassette domain-containing protein [Solwaraspora sp. WMMD1047]